MRLRAAISSTKTRRIDVESDAGCPDFAELGEAVCRELESQWYDGVDLEEIRAEIRFVIS